MTTTTPNTIALAWTGASGIQYGLRLLESLVHAQVEVHLMLSKPAQVVIGMETDLKLPGRSAEIARFFSERFTARSGQIQVFGRDEWTAPSASGSARVDAMVICPCSMGTLSAVACGASRSLIERAADVILKERRRLVIVPRETPFSEIHLENMLKLARMGAVILPANPGFYHRPVDVQGVVDFIVARVLDQIGIDNELVPRWGGPMEA